MDIRTSLKILEAQPRKIISKPPANPDRAAMIIRANAAWRLLQSIPSGSFKPSAKLSGEIASDLRNLQTEHEAEAETDPSIGPFDTVDVIQEIADRAVKWIFGHGKADIARLHDEYQTLMAEHQGYDDEPGNLNYIESSQYLACLDAQEKLLLAMDFFVPSKFETYGRFFDACQKMAEAFAEPIQTFEPPVTEEVQDQIGMIFPVILLVLKAGSTKAGVSA